MSAGRTGTVSISSCSSSPTISRVRASLKGIANRHGANHSTLLYWLKKHQRGELTDDDHLNDQVREYEAQIAALERKVGQLTMELDALKKGLRVIPVTPNGPLSLISGPAVSRPSEDAGS